MGEQNYGHYEDKRNKLISSWGYLGYTLLFFIPIVGLVLLIVFSFSENRNKRNFARSFWCALLTAFIVAVVFIIGRAISIRQNWSLFDMGSQTEQRHTMASNTHLDQENKTRSSSDDENNGGKESDGNESKEIAAVSPTPQPTTTHAPSGVTPSFKKAMDAYETFFDEYIAFMKKYNNSSGTDLSLLADYSNYMLKYAAYMEEIEKIDDKELSDADAAYYLEVTTRINSKLINAIS